MSRPFSNDALNTVLAAALFGVCCSTDIPYIPSNADPIRPVDGLEFFISFIALIGFLVVFSRIRHPAALAVAIAVCAAIWIGHGAAMHLILDICGAR